MNPNQVTAAVSNPHFYSNQQHFWNMLQYLFADYQSRKVHTFLPHQTFRNICIQTNELIESIEDYAVIERNKLLLYHTYYLLIKNIRAQKTVTRMTVDEPPDVLSAMYQLYKRLLELKAGPMTLFAHTLT